MARARSKRLPMSEALTRQFSKRQKICDIISPLLLADVIEPRTDTYTIDFAVKAPQQQPEVGFYWSDIVARQQFAATAQVDWLDVDPEQARAQIYEQTHNEIDELYRRLDEMIKTRRP